MIEEDTPNYQRYHAESNALELYYSSAFANTVGPFQVKWPQDYISKEFYKVL